MMIRVSLKAVVFAVMCSAGLSVSLATSRAADYTLHTVAEGLAFPWSLAFLPDGDILVTEREGRLRIIRGGDLLPDPVSGLPDILAAGQGGLMDIRLHPDFVQNKLVYLSYAHGDTGSNQLRVARAQYENGALSNLEVVFGSEPMKETPVHYGARLAFLPDGTLLITSGDDFIHRERAQVLDNHFGKLLRINADGTIPDDNPFLGTAGARPEIWSYGHRNQQGLLVDPVSGRVYLHEHGPMGGDELNLIDPGKNYGWPAATYGLDYSGARISPYQELPGMEMPVEYWVPSIAPGGMTLYDGDAFPAWQGDIFIAALANMTVRRLDMENGEVRDQETLFAEVQERFREVRTGPDGYLYLLTDSADGRVIQVRPGNS
ncbi:MAG: PQQ-dependent sugar dehydrogenase [Rhodospirillaceae bacterium]